MNFFNRVQHCSDHFSNVTITFAFKDRATEVILEQTKVPTADYERTKEGWNQHFW